MTVQLAIIRYDNAAVFTAKVIEISGDLNEAYRRKEHYQRTLQEPNVSYGVRVMKTPVDTDNPDYLQEASRILWPHRYGGPQFTKLDETASGRKRPKGGD